MAVGGGDGNGGGGGGVATAILSPVGGHRQPSNVRPGGRCRRTRVERRDRETRGVRIHLSRVVFFGHIITGSSGRFPIASILYTVVFIAHHCTSSILLLTSLLFIVAVYTRHDDRLIHTTQSAAVLIIPTTHTSSNSQQSF